MVYARNRVESDPTLIKDTIGMGYIFYNTSISTEYGNVSVNTIRRDYGMAIGEDKIYDKSEPATEYFDALVFRSSSSRITGLLFSVCHALRTVK